MPARGAESHYFLLFTTAGWVGLRGVGRRSQQDAQPLFCALEPSGTRMQSGRPSALLICLCAHHAVGRIYFVQ